jgi:FtsZ-interacting cell division protein ZipA
MRKLRATWLAVIGSVLLLSLSVAGVFGHATSGFDMAASMAAFTSHSESDDPTTDVDENTDEDTSVDEDASEDADEDTDTDETADQESETEPQTPTDTHGACVAAVAQSDAVGGKNLNHGGAVSEAARVTCKSTDAPVSPRTDKLAARDARLAARDARQAEHEATKATRAHGHSH